MAWKKRPAQPQAERSGDRAKARNYAVELLSRQDHSTAVLYEKLCRRYTEEAAAFAVAEMVQLGYADDARYARGKARQLYGQHKSRRVIARALVEKGVPKELAAQTLEELYAEWGEELSARQQWEEEPQPEAADPEAAAALALVEKSYRRKLAEGRSDLVLAALQRRGFGYRTARAALRQAALAAESGQ